jgi:hypothetical protein
MVPERETPPEGKGKCTGMLRQARLQFKYQQIKDPDSREDDTIPGTTSPRQIPRQQTGADSRLFRMLFPVFVMVALLVIPALAGTDPGAALQENTSSPQVVKVGVYVMDFKSFSVEEGTVQVNFYLSLKSDTPVSINDIEILNGQATSVDTLTDTPNEKYYRVFASIDADPDLRLYPFDRHVLPIRIEPKTRDSGGMVFSINQNQSGLDDEAELPGWQYGSTSSLIENHSYGPGETPYSRAVYGYQIRRDTASTVLKFFLPIMLIIIVSLSSLMMKVSSRLGLNASMFLAAVLIHWRVADAIPLVAYATFLDFFMIITYATLVMVLVSGILLMKYTEAKDTARADRVYRWSIRFIPAISIVLYTILFLAFLR